jgi:hypothetical protein
VLLLDKFFLSNPDIEPVTSTSSPASAAVEVTATASPSIAVLPFANMSADESSTYFSDGLADTLLHMLAQIREIRVAARASSFQFRDQNTDTKAAASLARQLLDEGIEDRQDSQVLALWAIWRDAGKYGTQKDALNYLQDHFPELYSDDPKLHLNKNHHFYVIGSMMLEAGDTARGRKLLDALSNRLSAAAGVFGTGLTYIGVQAVLGNELNAMENFRAYTGSPGYPEFWPIWLERDPGLASIRNEPEFVEYIAKLRKTAAEQRALLPELLAAQ